jgi:hypothetical protein
MAATSGRPRRGRATGVASAFVLAVALALAWGAWRALPPRDFDAALAHLIDGDADRVERLGCLGVLRDRGAERWRRDGDIRAGVIAATAAIAVGDEAAYARLADELRGRTPWLPSGPATGEPAGDGLAEEASFGETHLRLWLLANRAAAAADRAEAARLYAEADRAAKYYRDPLLARLAAAGAAANR